MHHEMMYLTTESPRLGVGSSGPLAAPFASWGDNVVCIFDRRCLASILYDLHTSEIPLLAEIREILVGKIPRSMS